MKNNIIGIAEEIKPYLNEIAERLWSGQAAVMIGAGFSKNAKKTNPSQKSFPDWNQLGDIFYKKIYNKEPESNERYLNVLELAEQVQAAFDRPTLDRLLYDSIPDMDYEPSELHDNLLELPWTDVFTTNYDTLLERACVNVGSKKFDIVLNKQDLTRCKKPRIFKLHGSFPHGPFIITREDFRKYPRDFAPFVNTVQQSFLENTICLIGFSGDDPNFLNWLDWLQDNLGKENSPKTFLVGIYNISDAQQKLLIQRGISLVDMSVCPAMRGNPTEALKSFFDYIQSKKEDVIFALPKNLLEWPGKQQFMYPDNGRNLQDQRPTTQATAGNVRIQSP